MNSSDRTRQLIASSSPADRGRHVAALASRIVPLMVLAVGSLVWLSTHQEALGQYQSFPSGSNAANFSAQGSGNQGAFRGNGPSASGAPFQNAGASGAAPSFQTASQRMSSTGASIPSLEEGTQQSSSSESNTESDVQASSWQMPGFFRKIAQGGWLMLPLGLCSLVVITLSLERLVALRRSRVIPKPFVNRFTECVEDGQLSYDEATELCEEFDCPVAEVFRAAVRRWGRPMFEVEQAVMDAGDRVSESLKRFLRVFHAISNVAPLLGLLGTVLGMIEAFETISSEESLGRPEMLASGISVALMTTAGGLSVAIPAYLAYMYFSSKSDNYLHEIDRLCQRVVDCISAEGLEDAESSQRSNRKRRAA